MNRSSLRWVALADIGSTDAFHVGDEAMLLGLIRDVEAFGRSVDWTVMSAGPDGSASRFGTAAVPRLTFTDCDGPTARESRLEDFDLALSSRPPERWALEAPRPWRESLGAIAASDAVVIAGGGNLCRSWPDQVFERVAVARAARRAGKPLAVVGQTIGPAFDARTRELTAEVLAGSVLVGVREAHSHRLALDLGTPPERTRLQHDDAIDLQAVTPAGAAGIAGGRPFIAVTLNHMGDPSDPLGIVTRLAAQLVDLGSRTGAAILLVPHVGESGGAPAHDVAVNAAVVAAAGAGCRLHAAPLPSMEEAVWYCRQARMVVSSRYHPVVFAIAAGTPALFLYQDHYTLVKGRGALAQVGLGEWILPVGLGALGLLAPAAHELWRRRDAVSAHLAAIRPDIDASRRRLIDALWRALAGEAGPLPPGAGDASFRGPVPEDEWVQTAHDGFAAVNARVAADHWQRERASLVREWELQRDRAGRSEAWAATLAETVERKEAELNQVRAELAKRTG